MFKLCVTEKLDNVKNADQKKDDGLANFLKL